jgi:hypothetical protein
MARAVASVQVVDHVSSRSQTEIGSNIGRVMTPKGTRGKVRDRPPMGSGPIALRPLHNQ